MAPRQWLQILGLQNTGLRRPLALLPIVLLLTVAPLAAQKESDADPKPVDLASVKLANDEHAAQFAKGLEFLEQGEFKKAASEFRRLKTKVKDKTERGHVDRAFLEAQGSVELEKALGYAHKERLRKALAHLDKVGPKYEGTEIGEQIAEQRDVVWGQLYFPIEQFEKKKRSEEKDESDDDSAGDDASDDDEEGEEEGRRGRNRRGGENDERTGFGQNTKLVEKSDDKKAVRHGEGALQWRTGKWLSAISFDNLPPNLTEYRYLNISVRSGSSAKPQIVLLFDCLDWRGNNGGQGRGRRGAAAVFQREGFSTAISPSSKWQDLRLDLRKMTAKGEASWSAVKALRVVHTPGISAELYIDEVRLEKE